MASSFNDVLISGQDATNYSINFSQSLGNSSDVGGGSNLSSQDRPSSTALHIGAVVMLIALLWGLFGNILTSFVILTNKDLKSTTNVFIVSLCINDILNLGINNMIVLISYFMMEWTMGLAICEMVMHFTVLFMGSSLWHTGLISIHRLIVVCFNNFYKKISKKAYTIFVLSFARIVPVLFIITPHLGRMSQFQPKLIRCLARKEFGLYTMLVSVTLQMLPSIVLIVCYIAIFIKVFRSSSAIRATRKREWLRREIQVTKMFGMVFLLIIIGYLPYGIVRFIDRKLELSADFYVGISVVYAVANSCNPIIYGVMDRKIRRYCFRALGLEESCMRSDQQMKKNISLRTNGEPEMATETAAVSTPGRTVAPTATTVAPTTSASSSLPPPCQV
ncbi:melatonin receptor type 1C-like [Aplysia californica]|uniref:Melatonin receptor type 1C-like n=1 Tax=Aplysia californica TaxID=6500 RepID=A0ABM0KAW8_APLCA|nr:melatonin receptor type 1C-like [Aplysia californica]